MKKKSLNYKIITLVHLRTFNIIKKILNVEENFNKNDKRKELIVQDFNLLEKFEKNKNLFLKNEFEELKLFLNNNNEKSSFIFEYWLLN